MLSIKTIRLLGPQVTIYNKYQDKTFELEVPEDRFILYEAEDQVGGRWRRGRVCGCCVVSAWQWL